MKKQLEEQLMQYHPNLKQYEKEIVLIEQFFQENGFFEQIEENEVFWNHMLSLIQRMDEKSLNDMEVDLELKEAYLTQAKTLIDTLSTVRDVEITEFELFLLGIYFQKFQEESGK